MANEILSSDITPKAAAPAPAGPAMPGPTVSPGPSAQDIIAELNRRGLSAQNLGGRALQRETRNRQMLADYNVQDVVNELRRRGIKTQLEAEPDTSAAAKNKSKLEAIDSDLLTRSHAADPKERAEALREIARRATELEYAQTFGAEPPDVVEGDAGSGSVTPKSLDEFVAEKHADKLNTAGAFSQNPEEDNRLRAQFLEAQKTDPQTKAEYDAYVAEAGNRPAVFSRGTPEYYAALRGKLEGKQTSQAMKAAQLKALPGVLEAKAKAEAEAPQRAQKSVDELSSQVQSNQTLKRYREQAAAVKTVQALATKPNPSNADDLSLIYAYVKLLDPGSVVREGEIKLAGNATPALTKLVVAARRLYSNKNAILDPSTRELYRDSANAVAKSAVDFARPEVERVSNLARERGVDPAKIFNADELATFGQSGATPAPSQPGATPAPARPVAAPAPAATPAGKRVIQNGNLFEQQPDGSYRFVGPAK